MIFLSSGGFFGLSLLVLFSGCVKSEEDNYQLRFCCAGRYAVALLELIYSIKLKLFCLESYLHRVRDGEQVRGGGREHLSNL